MLVGGRRGRGEEHVSEGKVNKKDMLEISVSESCSKVLFVVVGGVWGKFFS